MYPLIKKKYNNIILLSNFKEKALLYNKIFNKYDLDIFKLHDDIKININHSYHNYQKKLLSNPRIYNKLIVKSNLNYYQDNNCQENDLIISINHIFVRNRKIINQIDKDNISDILSLFSGNSHIIYSAIALKYKDKIKIKDSFSRIKLKKLSYEEELNYINFVTNYKKIIVNYDIDNFFLHIISKIIGSNLQYGVNIKDLFNMLNNL